MCVNLGSVRVNSLTLTQCEHKAVNTRLRTANGRRTSMSWSCWLFLAWICLQLCRQQCTICKRKMHHAFILLRLPPRPTHPAARWTNTDPEVGKHHEDNTAAWDPAVFQQTRLRDSVAQFTLGCSLKWYDSTHSYKLNKAKIWIPLSCLPMPPFLVTFKLQNKYEPRRIKDSPNCYLLCGNAGRNEKSAL